MRDKYVHIYLSRNSALFRKRINEWNSTLVCNHNRFASSSKKNLKRNRQIHEYINMLNLRNEALCKVVAPKLTCRCAICIIDRHTYIIIVIISLMVWQLETKKNVCMRETELVTLPTSKRLRAGGASIAVAFDPTLTNSHLHIKHSWELQNRYILSKVFSQLDCCWTTTQRSIKFSSLIVF